MRDQKIGTSSSLAVGVIFAAKPFLQILTNPLVGWFVDRYLLHQFAIFLVSTLGLFESFDR